MQLRAFLAAIFFVITMLCSVPHAEARRGFAVGFGPMGNIFLVDTIPIMDPGIGGYTYFQYRYAEQFAFRAAFMISTQNGSNVNSGDNGILLLGMPTIDLQYYLRSGDPRLDPFLFIGTGAYFLTEGSIANDTGGIGVGTNIGVGLDCYMTKTVSLGFEGVFRVIGIISDTGTPSSSSAIFPYSLMANITFHF